MSRTTLITVGCFIGVILCLAVAWALPPEPDRASLITQEHRLMDGISMRTEDIFLFPSEHFKFLRVYCRYLGGDPNQHYHLRASIRIAPDGPEIDPEYMWQVGVPDDHKGGIPMVWEFRTAPEGSKHFIMRVYFRPLTPFPASPALEQHVDYDLPYLPKLTPHGEIGA